MYRLINEAESKRYRSDCSETLKETCRLLKEKGISAQFELVGSGARNLITKNGNAPYDLDYNLIIVKADDEYWDNLRKLKDTVRVALNEALGLQSAFSDAQDSTSVLTSILHFTNSPNVQFKFDVCILAKNSNGNYCRLIHNKNTWINYSYTEQFTWNEVPNSRDVSKKAQSIKDAGEWISVRKRYEELKNLYLERQDNKHPSYIVYVEAVNEVYSKIKVKAKKTTIKPTPRSVVAQKKITKTAFNVDIQQTLSKAKKYTNSIISKAASIACKNYDGRITAKQVQKELRGALGQKTGDEIFSRISSKLK